MRQKNDLTGVCLALPPNLGAEKHDDLMDSVVYLILGVFGDGIDLQKIVWI
jgi:hypothetical protein